MCKDKETNESMREYQEKSVLELLSNDLICHREHVDKLYSRALKLVVLVIVALGAMFTVGATFLFGKKLDAERFEYTYGVKEEISNIVENITESYINETKMEIRKEASLISESEIARASDGLDAKFRNKLQESIDKGIKNLQDSEKLEEILKSSLEQPRNLKQIQVNGVCFEPKRAVRCAVEFGSVAQDNFILIEGQGSCKTHGYYPSRETLILAEAPCIKTGKG